MNLHGSITVIAKCDGVEVYNSGKQCNYVTKLGHSLVAKFLANLFANSLSKSYTVNNIYDLGNVYSIGSFFTSTSLGLYLVNAPDFIPSPDQTILPFLNPDNTFNTNKLVAYATNNTIDTTNPVSLKGSVINTSFDSDLRKVTVCYSFPKEIFAREFDTVCVGFDVNKFSLIAKDFLNFSKLTTTDATTYLTDDNKTLLTAIQGSSIVPCELDNDTLTIKENTINELYSKAQKGVTRLIDGFHVGHTGTSIIATPVADGQTTGGGVGRIYGVNYEVVDGFVYCIGEDLSPTPDEYFLTKCGFVQEEVPNSNPVEYVTKLKEISAIKLPYNKPELIKYEGSLWLGVPLDTSGVSKLLLFSEFTDVANPTTSFTGRCFVGHRSSYNCSLGGVEYLVIADSNTSGRRGVDCFKAGSNTTGTHKGLVHGRLAYLPTSGGNMFSALKFSQKNIPKTADTLDIIYEYTIE